MVKAAALYIVVIVSLLIAVISASLLTIAFFYRLESKNLFASCTHPVHHAIVREMWVICAVFPHLIHFVSFLTHQDHPHETLRSPAQAEGFGFSVQAASAELIGAPSTEFRDS